MFCSDCGAATASDAKFCIQCGAKVGERVEDRERKIIATLEPLAPRQQFKEMPIEATESTIYKGRTLFRGSSGKWIVAGIQNSGYEKLNEAMLFVDTLPISTSKLAPSAALSSQADSTTVYKGHTLVNIGERKWKISGFDSAVYLDISAAKQRIDVLEKATGEAVKEGVVDRVQETAQNTESIIFFDEENIEYAGFWVRAGATMIDTLLICCITLPLSVLIYGWGYLSYEGLIQGPADFLISWVSPLIGTVWFWTKRQATPGKAALSLRVVDAETGQSLSIGQSIGRYLGFFVSLIPLGLGFIWIGIDSRKQGWHDKLASTVVVRAKNNGPAPVKFPQAQHGRQR